MPLQIHRHRRHIIALAAGVPDIVVHRLYVEFEVVGPLGNMIALIAEKLNVLMHGSLVAPHMGGRSGHMIAFVAGDLFLCRRPTATVATAAGV